MRVRVDFYDEYLKQDDRWASFHLDSATSDDATSFRRAARVFGSVVGADHLVTITLSYDDGSRTVITKDD